MVLAALLLAVAQEISPSAEVAALEAAALREDLPDSKYGSDKLLRGKAYARLGALATPESLAAVGCIEAEARTRTPSHAFRPGRQIHPGWHMTDQLIDAHLRAVVDGRTYAIYRDFVYGGDDLLLISTAHPESRGAWSGPHLIPLKIDRGMRDLQMRAGARRTLVLSYGQAGTRAPQEVSISIDDVLRDTDGDGLTDVEEERLGLNPRVADTDGDGLRDGDDPAPDFAPGKSGATEIILEKAFFAAFGLSGAQYTMFAADNPTAAHLQVWGTRGHVVYFAPKTAAFGRIIVAWKITEMDDKTATVELSDAEGPLAAGGITVTLRAVNGQWYVVSLATTWIS